jgi:hypothetical protein
VSNPFANGPQGPAGQQPQGQPYGQQPYGQQPPQQPYGQVPPQGYYGAPQPQQPQRKPWLKYLRIAVPVIVVVIAIIGYLARDKDSATDAKVDDCLNAPKNVKDTKTVSCDSADAAWRVIDKFSGTSQTSKCDTEEAQAKGSVASIYWTGTGKGVLCLTITKHTTLAQAQTMESSLTQEVLDQTREELAAQGVRDVK